MKIHLDSIGCRLNQSEIERYSAHFRMAGHTIVGSADESDVVVLNTCTVTSKAAADSRSKVRSSHRRNPRARIVLTGCWSSLEESHAYGLPGVDAVIQNDDKDRLVPLLLNISPEIFEREPVSREPIPGIRARTRAFIKAQDGCDNRCTFCVTTIARGPARSISPERIIMEVRAAVGGGALEAVLTGVQLSGYGHDLDDEINLKWLIGEVLENTEISRLRLSSLEPWNLPPDFFELWENPRLCRQLHLPLQSGSAGVLKRMVRPITPQAYSEIVESGRKAIPDLAITTDIIVGFPGETEQEFQESLGFIRQMNFAGAHIFRYSPRPGTPAIRLPDHVPVLVARERSRQLQALVDDCAADYAEGFIGAELGVLWETATALDGSGWEVVGLSDNYLRVSSHLPSKRLNTISRVKIREVGNGGIFGEVTD